MAIKYADGSDSDTGRCVQFLQTHINGSLYWADQTDWTVCTGLTLTITPKASTNKLILRAQVHQAAAESSGNGDFSASIAFKKGGTLLTYTTYSTWGYGDYQEYVNDMICHFHLEQDSVKELKLQVIHQHKHLMLSYALVRQIGLVIMYMLVEPTEEKMVGITHQMFVVLSL